MKPFDQHGAFCLTQDGGALRRVAVRGAGVTALAQGLGFAFQMIATIILARLLTPADFGLVAIVTTFSLLLMNAGFNGVTETVVQREELDHGLASNLFWITVSVGLVLTIAFAAAGTVLARVYGDPRVAPVAVALSATIFLSSASVMHLALLKRGLRFSVVSANDLVARATAVTVSIVLGWAGWGYWALVAGAVALPLTACLGAWLRCSWMPGRPRRRDGTGQMMRFAMNTYGHFAANYCTRNFDNFLVGWFFGPASLGFYKKAYDLCVLPVAQLSDPLNSVGMPVLSRLRHDPEQYRRYALRALSTLAFVGMGLGAGLALSGKDLILVVLGPRWEESGRIFTFFAPGIGAMLLYLAYSWIHLSLGRADRLLRWGLIEFAVIGLLFVIGLRWGPVGVALAWVVSSWTLTIPALWYAGRPAGLRVDALVGAIWKYVVASALAGGTAAVILRQMPSLQSAPGWIGAVDRSVTMTVMFAALYLAAVVLLHGGWEPISQMAGLVRDMLPSRAGRGRAGVTAAMAPGAPGATAVSTSG
jgi:O-antigen/teichoic acid export membrane protein